MKLNFILVSQNTRIFGIVHRGKQNKNLNAAEQNFHSTGRKLVHKAINPLKSTNKMQKPLIFNLQVKTNYTITLKSCNWLISRCAT